LSSNILTVWLLNNTITVCDTVRCWDTYCDWADSAGLPRQYRSPLGTTATSYGV